MKTLYDKETLVKMVSSMLRYFDKQENKDEIIKAAQILMTRIKESSDKVELDSELLESILFTQNEDGTKNVVKDVFFGLKSNFLGFCSCLGTFISCLFLYLETGNLNKKSTKFLIPYVLLSLFATILSLTIYVMNLY